MLTKALVKLHLALTHYTFADKGNKLGGNDVYTPELYLYQGFEKAPARHYISSQEESLY
jgi:hypothetical protein